MPASYHSFVLVAPNSRIDRPTPGKLNSSMVIKADALEESIGKRVDAMGVVGTLSTVGKIVAPDTLETLARSLVKLHRSAKFNYADKFGVSLQEIKPAPKEQPASQTQSEPAKEVKGTCACEACGVEVESKVVYYCSMNKAKFVGKVLCQSCQKKPLPADEPEIIDLVEIDADKGSETEKHGNCTKCGTPIDKKVVYFCRLNKKRFNGEVLCRTCQTA